MPKPVVFNNTVLRDGHQSLAATRMTTEQMKPAAPLLDALECGALETWGGATIDSAMRFLGEHPFDRLDTLKKLAPNTPHMMLLRGQNIVQYAHFPDDVVETFTTKSAQHGMDIFRIFDALNDPRNMKTAIDAARKAGKEAHGTICYTRSPVHTLEKFIELGTTLAEMGCDTIVIKDMAGLIPPQVAYNMVKGIKANVKVPVWIHTHETSGLGAPTYYAAIEAGVDAIDTSIIPFANGTGQPDTGRMLALLENHPRRPHFSEEKMRILAELRRHFEKVYHELSAFTAHKNEVVDSDALMYQVPGGMLSNFRNQLKEQKMENKFDEVFAEIPHVRKCLGWIPPVTPTSQIVGVQAMLNVKFGRWQNFSPQAIDIALGYYGTTPAPVDEEVRKLAAQKSGKDPITCRPADLKQPGMAGLLRQLKDEGLDATEENAVLYAMFPQELTGVLKGGLSSPAPKAPAPAPVPAASASSSNLTLTINGRRHEVMVEEMP